MRKYYIDGYKLTIEEIVSAVKGELGDICIAQGAAERCRSSRSQINRWLEKGAPVVYGVNTGLGNLKDTVLSPEDHLKWNKSIPYPHAVGMGDTINPDITRASLLIRANVLCRGYSAVRPELIQRMLDIFNAGISPAVLELGSTGLSDLGPLAQSAMVVAGLEEAEVFYRGKLKNAVECFRQVGLEPVFNLECKEVLAQMNGSTMTQAIAVFAVYNMRQLLSLGNDVEKAINSDPRFQLDSKCEVYAAVEQAFKFILEIIEFENNISCDNPLLFKVDGENYEAVMGCNCSNTQVGYVLDLLNVLISEKSNFICEMISRLGCHRTAALALVKEIKTLCLPASADSIPTKGNQEDHVEFSYGAARKAMKAVKAYRLLMAYFIDSLIRMGFAADADQHGILHEIFDNMNAVGRDAISVRRLAAIEGFLGEKFSLIGLD